MITTLFILSLIGAPTPRDLLLDIQEQAKFVTKHAPAFLRIHYKQPMAEELDRTFQPTSRVLGALVDVGGEARVLVPTHRVSGVKRADIELSDGRRVPGIFDLENASESAPFQILAPRDPDVMKGVSALKWTKKASPPEGLMLWAIEWPLGQQLPNSTAQPILIRTSLGSPVEPPLERFFYVALGGADGLALVDHEGFVQCLVFRSVPGIQAKSLCAPENAIFKSVARSKK